MDGIILVDKEAGWTSHDVVAKVRNSLSKGLLSILQLDAVSGSQEKQEKRTDGTPKERQTPADTAMRQKPAGMSGFARQQGKAMRKSKVGHTGTLDPFATGLLVLVVGSYTKRAQEFSKMDKTYEAEMVLGATSTTGDINGQISDLGTLISEKPSREGLENVFRQFEGVQMQMPHKYSAKKINGQKAYDLARAGKEVKLEPVQVTVHSLEITDYNHPKVKFTASVSSGTYIRSLAEDIGQELGTGAYLSALRRTSVGEYRIEEAKTIDKIITNDIINI